MTRLSEEAVAHVSDVARAWLGLSVTSAVPRMPEALARRLLRIEEYEQPHRDQWGNWEFGFGASFREGRLLEPDVDTWLLERRRELADGSEPLWPQGRPFAMCLTHDVDLIAETVTPRQAFRSMRLSLLDDRRSRMRLARPSVRAARAVYHGISAAPAAEALERCLEVERSAGVSATYFFTSYPAGDGHRYDCAYDFGDVCRFGGRRVSVADVIGEIAREGFEVGLHGSYNSAVVPGRLAAEKNLLKLATGITATSTRQHFLHWDIRTTPRLQTEAGFTIDSTLGFNRNIGYRTGASLPFRWFDAERDCALDLVQLPPLVHDGALLRDDALELGVEVASLTLHGFLDRIAEVGGVATVVVHPNNLISPDHLRLFREVVEYGTGRGAWFASVRDLDAWLRARL